MAGSSSTTVRPIISTYHATNPTRPSVWISTKNSSAAVGVVLCRASQDIGSNAHVAGACEERRWPTRPWTLEAARREKLRRIEPLGLDPGRRFDDYKAIADVRISLPEGSEPRPRQFSVAGRIMLRARAG